MGHSLTYWIVAVLVVMLVGISKSGFASGSGVVATPLLALVMPVADGAALMLPILLFVDVFNLRYYRNDFDRPNLKILLPGAVIGIVFGSLFFRQFIEQEQVLEFGLGLMGLAFLAYEAYRAMLAQDTAAYLLPSAVGFLLGILAGFISTLTHAGVPPVSIYLIPQKLAPKVFVGTVAYLFFIVNALKLIPYAMLGLLKVGSLTTTLLLLPPTFVGIKLGYWLNGKMSQEVFRRFIYVILFFTSVQLLLGRSLLGLVVG